jgi:hypothetical protein
MSAADSFIIHFPQPSDKEGNEIDFVRVDGSGHMFKAEPKACVVVLGSEEIEGKDREFVSIHPFHANPMEPGEIIAGTDQYARVTKGPREGLILYKPYIKEHEQARPVGHFFWVDELTDENELALSPTHRKPLKAVVEHMQKSREVLIPQDRVKWPVLYGQEDERCVPVAIKRPNTYVLQAVAPMPLSEKTEEEKRIAQHEVERLFGFGHSIEEPLTWRAWHTLLKWSGKTMFPIQPFHIYKGTKIFIHLSEDFPVFQMVKKRHVADTDSLNGRFSGIRFDMFRFFGAPAHRRLFPGTSAA